ncbi:MAG: phosphate/phosphite/phosphonate ABC transporter substrate-binding protein [Calditrichaeota bacterium]|nr:phosphate/phosphite/phosphonate ABC transporter substrate-binding protein [Calditrichota bacterium]
MTIAKKLIPFIVLLAALISHAKSTKEDNADNYLGIGYSSELISGTDIRDIKIALKMWSGELIKGLSPDYSARTFIFNDRDSYIAAINANKVNIITMSSLDYMIIQNKVNIQPACVAIENGKVMQEYILLVHRESAMTELKDLRDKQLAVLAGVDEKYSNMWLDVLLHKKGLPEKEKFFSRLKHVSKQSQAVFPVFFRQSDACIVTQGAFDTMVELNPQMGGSLIIIARSAPYLKSLNCFSNTIAKEKQNKIMKLILRLDNNPAGKQIFTLFRISKLVPFQSSYLKNVGTLFKEHQKLNGVKM